MHGQGWWLTGTAGTRLIGAFTGALTDALTDVPTDAPKEGLNFARNGGRNQEDGPGRPGA
jgi:hypothetical protein